jgi:quercetin dioxygenase-like cupin family protein
MTNHSPLPPIRRIVTSHNDEAKAIVIHDSFIHGEIQPHGNAVTLLWSSDFSPAEVTSKEDKGTVETGHVNDGSILRIVDFPPHSTGILHRSVSLDYVVVHKGTVLLTLDDGTRLPVSEGEVVVQQATMHGWDNESDYWARILCILMPAKAPVVNGVKLDAHVTFAVK